MTESGGDSKILAALTDADRAGELIGVAFDFALEQPLSRFVELSLVLDHIDQVLTEAAAGRVVREHAAEFLEREQARAAERADRLGDWLTPEATQTLRDLAGRPVQLDRSTLEAIVQQEAVREMLRAVVTETLDRFVATLSPSGKGGGVLGSLGRGAVGFGKGLLSSVSRQFETQVRKAARSFIDGSLSFLAARLVDHLTRPETAKQMGKMAQSGFERAIETETAKAIEVARRAPVEELLELVPGLVSYNLARDDVRAAILDEARIALEIEGGRTIRELLEDAGAVEHWRAEVVRLGAPMLNELVSTSAFAAWLASTGFTQRSGD